MIRPQASLRRETGSWTTNIETLGGHRYRAHKPDGYRCDTNFDIEQVGDILVANQSLPGKGRDHAVVASQCDGLTLEDVTVYASPVFGFLELGCHGAVYRRCKIDRRPPETDPVQRGLRRFRSLNADAFHSIDATKGPAIIGCVAKFQGDDCVNIHGTYCLVMAGRGNEVRAVARSESEFAPGDEISFMPYSGPRPANARAVSIQADAPINPTERAYIQKMPLDESIRKALLGPKAHFFILTLDRPVSLAMGAGLCAAGRVGDGCVVRDCDFGFNRSRGIIIKASHAKVIGNKISHTWMTAILAAPEFFWWLEAGCPDHLAIRDNTIIGCRGAPIDLTVRGGDNQPIPGGALRDLEIHGNTIVPGIRP